MRKSEEPSPTEVECYWKKLALSTVKGVKSKSIDELSGVCTDVVCNNAVLVKFIDLGISKNHEAGVIRYSPNIVMKKTLYMDHFVIHFTETQEEFTCANFLRYCQNEMVPEMCQKIFNETI